MNDIGVIILNYNNYQLSIKAVNQIKNIEGIDIVVVDNKSINNSYEILKGEFLNDNHIWVISSPRNGGYSYGNNYGIKFLEQINSLLKYIVIMNPDVRIVNYDIFKMYKKVLMNNKDIGLVSSFQILNNEISERTKGYWTLPSGLNAIFDLTYFNKLFKKKETYHVTKEDNQLLLDVDVVVGALFMIPLKILKEIDYLDENVFLYYEENILSCRLHNINLKESILINTYYFHDHEHNNAYKNDFKKFLKNLNITFKSKNYFLKNYLKIGLFKYIFSIIIWYINKCITTIVWIIKNIRRVFQ